jgi:hypothetical protein
MRPVFTSLSALFAAGVVALGLMAQPALARVDLYVGVAPPEPRVEVVPAPRRGYVWAPGYWAWRGRHHVWMPGHWIRARVGWHWVPDRWEHAGDRWVYRRGDWTHD